MITLIPNSWGSSRPSLREFNKCHEPGGRPAGGQFTSASSGGCAGGEATQAGVAAFKALKGDWARVNNELLDYVDDPTHPAVAAKVEQLKAIVKQMYDLDIDPGGLEGIGLPGGPRDMVVIGAGPGGLSAAVIGGVDGLDTLFLDASSEPGGQAKHTSRVENYPGDVIGASGKDLTGRLHEQALRVGAQGKLGVRVTNIAHNEKTGIKTLTLSDGTKIETRAVVIAGGVEMTSMQFPGSDSPQVIHNDALRLSQEGEGQHVVIVGGGNSAAQAALGSARKARSVTLLARSPIEKSMSDYQVHALRNHPRIRVVVGDELASVDTRGLVTASGARIPAHRVGLFVGGAPNTKWLPSTIKLENGRVVVDNNLETGVPGIFAVGDIRHGNGGRIGTAVGDGQVAARGVAWYFRRLREKPK